jgi:ABC-type glycerol-3-phosphate transport system substrate-binding protein
MKKKALLATILTCSLVASIFVGCGSSSSSSDGGKITLTILSQHTDFVNTKFKDYAKEYAKIHPNVTLKFEAYTDYDNATKTRMNTTDYGDVLMIPNTVKQSEWPNYFASLGNEKDYTSKYYGMDGQGDSFGGKVYGIPSEMNVSGMVYNKKVFTEAGITKLPTSEDEFLADMKLIKDKTSAIPFYTNYKDGWPLVQWEPDTLSVSGKNTYTNQDMEDTDTPFAPGTPHYIVYKYMYDLAKDKLIEQDPTTTDWEKSKTMMAQGKIAVMELGSFAITQIQAQATNKDDIGYMPFPYQVDGKSYTNLSADYLYGVNKNSKNVQAAKDLVTWFVEKSTYAADNGTVSTLKSVALPSDLNAFKDLNVQFLIPAAAKKDQAGWNDEIDKDGEVGLWTPDFRQKIIEAAIGNSNQTYDQIMNDLNAKWKTGRAEVMSQK